MTEKIAETEEMIANTEIKNEENENNKEKVNPPAQMITYEEMALVALKKLYPWEVKIVRDQWKEVSHSEQAKNMTEEDYMKIMLPQVLQKRKNDFEAYDREKRMSEHVKPFKIRANPALFRKHYPTGFPELDSALNGGFTPGVHYIGAVSSLGKSTFLLQIADHMASEKIPVIYISLEMCAVDLAAKLVSMHSLQLSFAYPSKAKSMGDLTHELVLTHMTDEEWKIMEEAACNTEINGEYLTIIERKTEGITIDYIEKYVRSYVETYQVKPVVIAISSFNRDYYSQPASLQAFKESGNIEYSSDTLIGLQLFGVGRKNVDVDEEKKKYPRTIEAILLKNRTGPSGKIIEYSFYAVHNYFKELQNNPFAEEAEEEEKRIEEEKKKEKEEKRLENKYKTKNSMKQMSFEDIENGSQPENGTELEKAKRKV